MFLGGDCVVLRERGGGSRVGGRWSEESGRRMWGWRLGLGRLSRWSMVELKVRGLGRKVGF